MPARTPLTAFSEHTKHEKIKGGNAKNWIFLLFLEIFL